MIGNVTSIYAQKDLALININAANTFTNNAKLKDNTITQEEKKEYSQSTRVTISEEA